jgi:hypothetical protein
LPLLLGCGRSDAEPGEDQKRRAQSQSQHLLDTSFAGA